MGQKHGSRGAYDYRKASEVVFLELRDSVFCTECELISYNNSPRCLACGSLAVISLSRVLGGSLRGQETARLIQHQEVHSVLGEVLRATNSSFDEPSMMPLVPFNVRRSSESAYALALPAAIPIPVLQTGVTRSCDLTGATGAAVAVSDGRRMVCRARAGRTAPDIGAEVPEVGLTSLSVRTGRLWRCDDTEHEPWVNRDACRMLGVRSLVIAPLALSNRVLGVLEVFSPTTFGFDDRGSAIVQLIAGALALAAVNRLNSHADAAVTGEDS